MAYTSRQYRTVVHNGRRNDFTSLAESEFELEILDLLDGGNARRLEQEKKSVERKGEKK